MVTAPQRRPSYQSGPELLVLAALLCASFVAHLVVWLVLGLLPPLRELFSQREEVELQVVEVTPPVPDEPAVEPTPPPPEPAVEPPPPPPVHRPRPAAPPPDEPPPPPPPPAEEAIADFTGQTLTNDEGPGAFTTEVGNGAAMEGPIGQPHAQVTGRHREGSAEGVVGGTGTDPNGDVPEADLSRRPSVPPSLAALLERNYPRRAQELGIEGSALLSVRIRADGRVQPLAVISETWEGFGEAGMRTLRESPPWDPPLDVNGRPVATVIRFRCTFSIRAF